MFKLFSNKFVVIGSGGPVYVPILTHQGWCPAMEIIPGS